MNGSSTTTITFEDDEISVVSEMTTPTVVSDVFVPKEEHYHEVKLQQLSYGQNNKKKDILGQVGRANAARKVSESSEVHGFTRRSSETHRPSVGVGGDGFNNNLLQRIIEDTGKWAYGTAMVEVWVMNKYNTHLMRAKGGFWVCPKFHRCSLNKDKDEDDWDGDQGDHDDSDGCSMDSNAISKSGDRTRTRTCHVCKLTNPSDLEYCRPTHVSAGVGLAGALWADIERPAKGVSIVSMKDTTTTTTTASNNHNNNNNNNNNTNEPSRPRIVWREIQPLANDPDQPYDKRLQLLAKCKLGYAAAIPFFVEGAQGIVIFMTKEGINPKKLKSSSNERYLHSAANLVGALYALHKPRLEAMTARRQEFKQLLQAAKAKILYLARIGVDLSQDTVTIPPNTLKRLSLTKTGNGLFDDDHDHKDHGSQRCCFSSASCQNFIQRSVVKSSPYVKQIHRKMISLKTKMKGSGVEPPPPVNYRQSIFTFVCVFLTLFLLTVLNKHIHETLGRENSMNIVPFGSFLALTYGLSAAPSAQPLSCISGQLLSMSIGMMVSWLPFPLWLRQPIAASCSITLMGKLGLPHPPAGATGIAFSSGNYTWNNIFMSLVGYIIIIVVAAIMNNLNNERQYPTFWGFQFLYCKWKRLLSQKITPFCVSTIRWFSHNPKQFMMKEKQVQEKQQGEQCPNNNNNNKNNNNYYDDDDDKNYNNSNHNSIYTRKTKLRFKDDPHVIQIYVDDTDCDIVAAVTTNGSYESDEEDDDTRASF